jgi:hypothetical protein
LRVSRIPDPDWAELFDDVTRPPPNPAMSSCIFGGGGRFHDRRVVKGGLIR